MRQIDRRTGLAVAMLTTASLVGCVPPPPMTASGPPAVATPNPPPYAEGPPGYPAYQQPYAPMRSSGPVVAPFAPPPPWPEYSMPASSPQVLWQPGYWGWTGAAYVWLPGHYAGRPWPSANWVPGSWQQWPQGWMWVDGRWTG